MSQFDLTPPEKTTFVYDIVEQVLEKIQAGDLQAGDRLPTERQLCEMLNVSRATVREAIQTLTGMGIVEARVGDGTFVKVIKPHLALGMALEQIARTVQRQDRLHLLQARTVVEKGIIELAVQHATTAQREELETVTAEWIQQCTEDDVKLDLHDQIHLTLAEMTANPLLVRVLQTLLEALPAEIRNYGLVSNDGPGDSQALQKELSIHSRLSQAVAEGHLEQALSVFDEHQSQEANLIQRYYTQQ